MYSLLKNGFVVSAMVCTLAAAAGAAQTVTILGSFDEQTASQVIGPLVQGTDGNLYGTSQSGGTGAGTAFKATLSGVVTLLHTFCSVGSCTDGQSPFGGLALGVDGNLYGTTGFGGNSNSGGTMFQLTPAGTLTTLYDFCPTLTAMDTCADGQLPSQLTRGSDNNFYGTTQSGGAGNNGTVFKITPAGAYTTLHSFCTQGGCLDGSEPDQPLVAGTDGNLYGTTPSGGTKGAGTIFKITPSGTYTTLYSFCPTGCVAGENGISSLIQGTDGSLYGVLTNSNGNGSIFRFSTAGVFTTVYTFCAQANCLDGQFPNAVIQARDGNLYGTALSGGANMQGTLFKLTPAGALTTLYNFCSQTNCTDGASPAAQLVEAASGVIYGTTTTGGTGIGNQGTLFSVTVQATVARSAALAAAADYLGDGKSNFTVWRPATSYWYSNDNAGKTSSTAWGAPTDLPVIGDFDGDGKTDVAVFRPANGFWYIIQSSNNAVVAKQWGESTDLPVAGDFDGDGKTDVAVFRPSNGFWYITASSNNEVIAKQWGATADVPVVGDFDGDGKSDIAVWRPSTGFWYIVQSSNNAVVAEQWGEATDIPVSGDFDGDGKTDIAVYRPSTGYWYIRQSSNGQVVAKQWGAPGDIPVARDYDGDGKTDLAVWRPSTGYWYVIESANGQIEAVQWGAATDTPVNNLGR